MTVEMQHALDREMEDALRIEDRTLRLDATLTVLVHQCRALVECQQKTAERVKHLVEESEAKFQRITGAKRLWQILKYIAAAGGGATIVKTLFAS